MNDLITLDRSSPEFDSYLRGTFAADKRALPIQSLNVNTQQERVTFRIVPTKDIRRPNFLVVWLKAIKPRSFILVLFPMFLVLMKNYLDEQLKDPFVIIFAVMGVLALFAATNLRNDYSDHMKGIDRLNPNTGSRAIQDGWLTADQVRRAAWRLVWLAALCSLPILFVFPMTIFVLLITAIMGFGAIFQRRFTFKDIEGGEFFILFMQGPLLTCGFEMAITGAVRIEALWLGILWGAMALFPIHLRNMENIIVNSQAGLANMVSYLGFDRAKKFIHRWWLFSVAGFIFYHLNYGGFYFFWLYSLIIIFVSMRFSMKLGDLNSPAGSDMVKLRRRGVYVFLITVGLWTLENLWYILTDT